MNSLTVPGIVLAKSTLVVPTTESGFTLPSVSTTPNRRKANAIMLHYNSNIDVWVSIDGTSAAPSNGFLMNNTNTTSVPNTNNVLVAYSTTTIKSYQQLIFYGMPTMRWVAASGTPSVEVYLLYIPQFGG